MYAVCDSRNSKVFYRSVILLSRLEYDRTYTVTTYFLLKLYSEINNTGQKDYRGYYIFKNSHYKKKRRQQNVNKRNKIKITKIYLKPQ